MLSKDLSQYTPHHSGHIAQHKLGSTVQQYEVRSLHSSRDTPHSTLRSTVHSAQCGTKYGALTAPPHSAGAVSPRRKTKYEGVLRPCLGCHVAAQGTTAFYMDVCLVSLVCFVLSPFFLFCCRCVFFCLICALLLSVCFVLSPSVIVLFCSVSFVLYCCRCVLFCLCLFCSVQFIFCSVHVCRRPTLSGTNAL